MILEVIYVVLLVLLLVGVFGSTAAPGNFAWWPAANPVVFLVLFIIIGIVLWGPGLAR
jgi:hypothetical protein